MAKRTCGYGNTRQCQQHPVMRLRSPKFPSAMAVAQDRLPVAPPGRPPRGDTAPPATLRCPTSLVDSPARPRRWRQQHDFRTACADVTFPEFPLSAVPEVNKCCLCPGARSWRRDLDDASSSDRRCAARDAKCAASSCARAACHRKIASCIVGTGLYRNTASA